MALLERVGTLLRANLNDLMDRAEDPEKLCKQLVLDMENQLMQVKTQVAMANRGPAPAQQEAEGAQGRGRRVERKGGARRREAEGRSRARGAGASLSSEQLACWLRATARRPGSGDRAAA